MRPEKKEEEVKRKKIRKAEKSALLGQFHFGPFRALSDLALTVVDTRNRSTATAKRCIDCTAVSVAKLYSLSYVLSSQEWWVDPPLDEGGTRALHRWNRELNVGFDRGASWRLNDLLGLRSRV